MKKQLLLFVLMMLTAVMLAACDRVADGDDYPEMTEFYTESCGLMDVPVDSVRHFKMKVDGFTDVFPDSKSHRLYPKIQANIKAASFRLTIIINDEWDGETFMYF